MSGRRSSKHARNGGRSNVPARTTPTGKSDDLVLVPVGDEAPDTFLVYGPSGHDSLELLDLQPLTLIPLQQRSDLGEALATSMGSLNLGLQALNGIGQAQGLVRLAPETMAMLNAGAKPVMSGGWNLGTLAVEGKFAAQVRWLPAGAQAAGVLASMGSAATMLAIQWQLNQISAQVRRNIALTETVVDILREGQLADVYAYHDAVAAELAHAHAIGGLHSSVVPHLTAQGTATALDKYVRIYMARMQGHGKKLAQLKGGKARHEWLETHMNAVLQDLNALLIAHRALFTYQGLRAADLTTHHSHDPLTPQYVSATYAKAIAHHEAIDDAAMPVIDAIYRHFRLMEVCPGGMGLTIRHRRVVPKEIAALAGELAKQVSTLTGAIRSEDPSEPNQDLFVLPGDKDIEGIASRLRWILTSSETLQAVVWGWSDAGWKWQGFLVITDRRMVLLDEAPFMNEGHLQLTMTPDEGKITWPDTGLDIWIDFGEKKIKFWLPKWYQSSAVKQLRDVIGAFAKTATATEAVEAAPEANGETTRA